MSNVYSLKDFLEGSPPWDGWRWAFVGSDAVGHQALREALGVETEVELSERSQEVALQIKPAFLKAFATLSKLQTDPVSWWANPTASKGPFQTPLFGWVVSFRLVVSLLDSEEDLVVVVEDPEVWDALVCNDLIDGNYAPGGSDTLAWLAIIKRIGRIAGRLVVGRLRRKLSGIRRRNDETVRGSDLLVHTWAENHEFTEEGFKDAFTGSLKEQIEGRGYQGTRITSFLLTRDQERKIESVPDPICVLWDYLSVRRLPTVFRRLIGLGSCRLTVEDHDLTALVHASLRRDLLSGDRLLYLLSHACYCELAERMPGLRIVLYPFENQPWEKMMCLVFGSRARMIACQHAIVGLTELNFFHDPEELDLVPLPNNLLVTGPYYETLMRAVFPTINLAVRGSHKRFVVSGGEGATANGQTLAALSISDDHNTEFLRALLRVLDASPPWLRGVTIKPHPSTPIRGDLLQALSEVPICSISSEPLGDLMEQCDVVISFGSSAAFDALFVGKRLLIFLSNGFKIEKTYGVLDSVVQYASTATLKERLQTSLEVHSGAQSSEPEQFFSPIDPENETFIVDGLIGPVT